MGILSTLWNKVTGAGNTAAASTPTTNTNTNAKTGSSTNNTTKIIDRGNLHSGNVGTKTGMGTSTGTGTGTGTGNTNKIIDRGNLYSGNTSTNRNSSISGLVSNYVNNVNNNSSSSANTGSSTSKVNSAVNTNANTNNYSSSPFITSTANSGTVTNTTTLPSTVKDTIDKYIAGDKTPVSTGTSGTASSQLSQSEFINNNAMRNTYGSYQDYLDGVTLAQKYAKIAGSLNVNKKDDTSTSYDATPVGYKGGVDNGNDLLVDPSGLSYTRNTSGGAVKAADLEGVYNGNDLFANRLAIPYSNNVSNGAIKAADLGTDRNTLTPVQLDPLTINKVVDRGNVYSGNVNTTNKIIDRGNLYPSGSNTSTKFSTAAPSVSYVLNPDGTKSLYKTIDGVNIDTGIKFAANGNEILPEQEFNRANLGNTGIEPKLDPGTGITYYYGNSNLADPGKTGYQNYLFQIGLQNEAAAGLDKDEEKTYKGLAEALSNATGQTYTSKDLIDNYGTLQAALLANGTENTDTNSGGGYSGGGSGGGGGGDVPETTGDYLYSMPEVTNTTTQTILNKMLPTGYNYDYNQRLNSRLNDIDASQQAYVNQTIPTIANTYQDQASNTLANLVSALRANRASGLTSGANRGAQAAADVQAVQSANSTNSENLNSLINTNLATFLQTLAGKRATAGSDTSTELNSYYSPMVSALSNILGYYNYGSAAAQVNNGGLQRQQSYLV